MVTVKKTLFDADTISIERNKIDKIIFYIDKNNGSIQTDDTNTKTNNTSCKQQCLSDTIVNQNILEIMQPHTVYERFKNVYKSLNEQILNGGTANIDIRYLDVKQNTQEWHDCRKFIITASRLACLLGLLGKSKFNLF